MQKRYLESVIFLALFSVIGLYWYSQNQMGTAYSYAGGDPSFNADFYHTLNGKLLDIWIGVGILGGVAVYWLVSLMKNFNPYLRRFILTITAVVLYILGVFVNQGMIKSNSASGYLSPTFSSGSGNLHYDYYTVGMIMVTYFVVLLIGDVLSSKEK